MHCLFRPWLEALATGLRMRRRVHVSGLGLRAISEALLWRRMGRRCDAVAGGAWLLTGYIGRSPEATVAVRVLHRVANGIGGTCLRWCMSLGDVRLARPPAVRRLRMLLQHLRREVRALHVCVIGLGRTRRGSDGRGPALSRIYGRI